MDTPLAWKLFFAAALMFGVGVLVTGVGIFLVLGPQGIGSIAGILDLAIPPFAFTLAAAPFLIVLFVLAAMLATAGIIAVGIVTMLRGSKSP